MLLPIRASVLLYLSTVKEGTVNTAMEALRPQYGTERQFTKANFVEHMLALKANGLIDEVECDLDEAGELRISYCINDEGRSTVKKYIPKRFQNN